VNVSLYQAASALNANARWLEIISENLAGSTIPGFKKQDLSFTAVQAGMLMPSGTTSRANGQPVSLPSVSNHMNFSQGDVRTTEVNTDLAIEGPGFFEVQLANGNNAYTRDGELKVNAQGELVTKQGYLVMGEGGPIQLDRSNATPMRVDPDGTVMQEGQVRGKLHLVAFKDPTLLTPIGGGMFTAKAPGIQVTDTKSTVKQGCIEGANTSSVLEMTNLINVMRSYEANQRVIQMQDERMGRAISELGNPS
jgi:flagellar basal-body rod protein FlgF